MHGNMMRTALMLAAMTALFVLVGAMLGGRGGMVIALVIAAATNLFAWWNSDRLALASTDAQEVDAGSAPDLVALVGELAARAQLPTPRVYLIHSDQPNAFATGRDPEHAAVAVNTGLIQMLTREELAGVIAHELAHVKNRDTLTMTITAALAGAISSIAHWGLFFGGRRDNGPGVIGSLLIAILAPMAAMVVQMAVSRGREYEADRIGAQICGNPHWLARALAKISGGVAAIPDANAEAHPAMAVDDEVNLVSALVKVEPGVGDFQVVNFRRRAILSTALITPVTSPKPFTAELAVMLNFYYGRTRASRVAMTPPPLF